MTAYRYDLHLHSCLSPCGDDQMTPANIAGVASLNGLQLTALTDHNSCKNCAAFMAACRRYGIVAVPGMELTTAEEIHAVCLFPELEAALDFDKHVHERLLPVKNRPEIFGDQLIVDENDEVQGSEELLLISATTITLGEAFRLVAERGGVCYPAHIDREANGIVAILGTVPPEPPFTAVELRDRANLEPYRQYGIGDKRVIFSSDAHYLWDISEGGNEITLDDEPYSSARVRRALIETLRGTV